MNRNETVLLLAGISGVYPNFKVTDVMVNFWESVLKQHSYSSMLGAFRLYASKANPFPPSVPGDLLAILIDQVVPGESEIDSNFQRVLAASSPYKKELRADLNPLEKKVGAEIGWQRMHMADCQSEIPWIKKEFVKSYQANARAFAAKNLPKILQLGFANCLEIGISEVDEGQDKKLLADILEGKKCKID